MRALLLALLLGCHGSPPDPVTVNRAPVAQTAPDAQLIPADARAGAFVRRRDPGTGAFSDTAGIYAGRRDSTGAYFDGNDTFVGRADSTNNYYDRNGTYAGRINDDGSFFDRTGAYAGRIDVSGNVYDSRGAVIGRTQDNCDECKADTTARILLAR